MKRPFRIEQLPMPTVGTDEETVSVHPSAQGLTRQTYYPNEVAEILGCSTSTVNALIKRGIIPAIHCDNPRINLIPKIGLKKWMDEGCRPIKADETK